MPMNQRIKGLWIDALLSGEFVQGRYSLRGDANERCCLGVLCEVHSKQTGKKWKGRKYLKQDGALSNYVLAWAGLDTGSAYACCVPIPPRREMTLARLNDNGKTFAEIAAIIKEHL